MSEAGYVAVIPPGQEPPKPVPPHPVPDLTEPDEQGNPGAADLPDLTEQEDAPTKKTKLPEGAPK